MQVCLLSGSSAAARTRSPACYAAGVSSIDTCSLRTGAAQPQASARSRSSEASQPQRSHALQLAAAQHKVHLEPQDDPAAGAVWRLTRTPSLVVTYW